MLIFFAEAVRLSVSDLTRRTALFCLWNSKDRGKDIFYVLMSQANSSDLILFKHVLSADLPVV